MTGFVPFIDTSGWQFGHWFSQSSPEQMTLKPGAPHPDLSKAVARGVQGVFHRSVNGVTIDPTYKLTADAAARDGLKLSAYIYARPDRSDARTAADVFLRSVAAGPAPTLPAMLDLENFDGQNEWSKARLADWIDAWLDIVDADLGRCILYISNWWAAPRLGDEMARYADRDWVGASYAHQPSGVDQSTWPPVPGHGDQWYGWLTTTQGGDPGDPDGPTPIKHMPPWAAWQGGSWALAADYGFPSGRMDFNIAHRDVWSRWTESAGPVPEPSPFPLPQPAPVPAPPKEAPVAETLYPVGYGTTLVTIDKCLAEAAAHHHPEYVRRLRAWLIAQEGRIGIGDAWRATGSQPDKPGFAPEGKSFHQDQKWSDGFIGGAAVDLVARNGTGKHRSPNWSEVPRQGSKEAAKWGLHCNIDSEAWHMQPVEADGHASWVAAGRPSPKRGYPLPTVEAPAPVPKPAPAPDRYVTAEALELVPNANAQTGWPVLLIQIGLNAYRFQHGQDQLVTDGVYGIRTIAAVQEFQTAKGLTPDGNVGAKTWTSFLTGKVWS